MLLQVFSSRLSLERASRTNVLPHLYFAISLYPQKLRIAHPEMHCHLVPLSHLHLFNQLAQDRTFTGDRRQVKLIRPAQEFVVVASDLLDRCAGGVIAEQLCVFLFRLPHLRFRFGNQPGQHFLGKPALAVQAADHFVLVALLLQSSPLGKRADIVPRKL